MSDLIAFYHKKNSTHKNHFLNFQPVHIYVENKVVLLLQFYFLRMSIMLVSLSAPHHLFGFRCLIVAFYWIIIFYIRKSYCIVLFISGNRRNTIPRSVASSSDNHIKSHQNLDLIWDLKNVAGKIFFTLSIVAYGEINGGVPLFIRMPVEFALDQSDGIA